MVNTVPSDYVTGTITLTNGSAAFTGTGTGWLAMMFRQGDLILDLPDAPEYIAIIDEVTTNTAGTLTRPWLGPTLTGAYRMRYQWDAGRVTAMSAFLREELGNGNLQAFAALVGSAGGVPVFIGPGAMEVRPATDFVNGVAYNVQVDTLADRAAFDGQSEGFAVLVSDVGDGRSALYSKASNTVGDWTDPAYITGPEGGTPDIAAGTTTTLPPGTPANVDIVPDGSGGYLINFDIPAGEGFVSRGAYSGATAYVKGDVVQNNGSSWVAKIATTGNAPPVLPVVSNTWWELLAAAGANGTGTGDMVGPASATDGAFVGFDGTTGKLTKELSNTVATSMLDTFAVTLKGLVPAPTTPDVAAGKVLAADGTWVTPASGSFTEKLINGRLLVNQRRTTSGSIIAGAVGYVGDLWVISNATNATLTWSVASSQSYGRNREENALTISFASAPTSGDTIIQYRAEGVNIVAGTVTTRVDVLNVGLLAAAPLSALFTQNFGSGGSSNVTVSAVTPPETGVGPRRAVVTLPSTAGKTIGAGSYLEQRWVFTPRAIGTMTVASFSMVEGDASAQPDAPDGLTLSQELAECQWQFVRVTDLPVGSRFSTGIGTGANNSQYTLPFQMRVAPAASHSGMTVATGGAAPAITAITANGNSAAGVGIQATAATTATDAIAQLRSSGPSAYLDLYAGLL